MLNIDEVGDVHNRINQLVDLFCKGNKAAFGRGADIQSGVLAGIIGGRKNKPSFEVLQKILTGYPTVNPTWLLFGRGPIIQGDVPKPMAQSPTNALPLDSLGDMVQQLVVAELNRRHMDGQVSAAWFKQSGNVRSEISQLVKRGHELIMQMHEIMVSKSQSEEDKARYAVMSYENERITEEVLRKRAELNAFAQAEVQAVQEAQATVYRIEGEPDITKPFGGLLSYRLGISQSAAQQLITASKIRAVYIEGEGYRVSEQAVREFLGESSFHMIIPSITSDDEPNA
jgi:hypothetical protein